ncbi:Nucleoside-diphosphate-sugar epimerase [Labilithrix luteola]|uniref:Nucleoside-diphosphate-sugar epimerase n=1 Tax=Labilithrix luteola TaxID=1391654 RepID=A0A0K1QG40_9BACT|nr:NAD-dependent epimerase/dehydratase family protein [Labilithrix luteola]AKV04721.1 Nucleoside-diphosphate-sugar epimerase [Labilithrix luteola]
MGRIAVFGATGAVGKSVAAAIRAKNEPYRVIGRSRAALDAAFGNDPLAQIMTWDPYETHSVVAAADGIDTIIYVVGVDYDKFELHPDLMRRTIEGAVAAGVRRIVLLGTVYPYGIPRTATVREEHPRDPHTFKGRKRKEQEDVLLEADKQGRIEATILRVPDFVGPGAEKSFLDGVFKAALKGSRATMVGPIDTPHQFAFVPDVGKLLVTLAQEPKARGRAFNFAGSGVTSQRDLAERIYGATHHKFKAMVAGRNTLRVMGLVSPMMRELVEMSYLHTKPVLLDDTALTELLGSVPRTSYDEAISKTLAQLRAKR